MHGLDEIKRADSDATNIAVLLAVAKRARRELSRQGPSPPDTYPAARRPVRASRGAADRVEHRQAAGASAPNGTTGQF